MKLIKTIITLSLVAILSSCSESVPEKVTSSYTSESYDWKKWDCYEFSSSGKYLFTIGYIPEINAEGYYEGKLFLKDTTSPIETAYRLSGVQHEWEWEKYQIRIDSNGTGRYWDFSNADEGEMVDSSELYECTSSDLEKFDMFMESIW
jgi:hypothetical protein